MPYLFNIFGNCNFSALCFRYQEDRRLKEESRLRELNRRNNDFNNSRKRSIRSNRQTKRDAIEMQNRRNMEREDSISSTSESSSSSPSSSIEEDFSRRRFFLIDGPTPGSFPLYYSSTSHIQYMNSGYYIDQ